MNGIIAAVIVLGIIVVIHELGHLLVAKMFRFKVETFSVGFGPRIAGFRLRETDYRISAIPLGGYVKMADANPFGDIACGSQEFISKPKYQRFLVAAAGPVMNGVLAVVLLAGLFMYGTPVAQTATSEPVVVRLGFVDAVERSIDMNTQYALLIVEMLGKLVQGEGSMKDLEGPVGIVRISGQAMDQGFPALIVLMALISLNLGIMNILPIPILDGGTMLLLILEWIMGRNLSAHFKERIVQVSLVFLLALTAFVLYNDVVKWAATSL
jgi:membrane-associated protease RseP (regulator of RpoE activity)